MFSNTDRTDVRIANIADNHHAEIRRITVIPTEITVSAYPSRRDDPNPNEPVRSRVPPHGASAHGARLTGPAGRDKKRAEGTRPGKQTVTPHFALSGNPMKNPQTTGPGYIPSAQVMYPVRSHSGAPQDDPPIKSKDAGTTPTVGPLQPYDGSCPYAQACPPPERAGTRLRFQTNIIPS